MKTIMALIFITLLATNTFAKDKDPVVEETTDSSGITQRTIKIKGLIDKPRTIFIIPRARLANTDKGSIEKYALTPLFPDLGIADHKTDIKSK